MCILLFLWGACPQTLARPRYSKQTGLACGKCHHNPHGGGDLTPVGQHFRDNGYVLKNTLPTAHLMRKILLLLGGLALFLVLFLGYRCLKRSD